MANCDWQFGSNAQTFLFCYARKTLWFLLIIPLANSQPRSFEFPNFNTYADLKQLKLEGDAFVSDSGIQLTNNAADPNSNWNGSVGRVISPQPIHLWNKSSNELGDFTTHFSFTIFSSNQSSSGDGLAFFLAGQNLTNLNGTSGLGRGGIGIGRVDNSASLETDYHFIAVEFDTFSNQWDPRGAHVGVNIDSMRSDILEQWSPYFSGTDIVYDCSIQYSSANNLLSVSLTSGFNERTASAASQYLTYNVNLSDILPDYVIVGISAASGDFSEEHTLQSWSFSTSLPTNDDPNEDSKMLLEGMGTGAGFSVSLIGLVYVLLWTRKKRKEDEEEEPASEATSDLNMDDEFQMNTGPKKISYGELVYATNNFGETHKGVKGYAAEVKIISQLRHKNLVKLIGWCHKKKDLLLIYEYAPNGSLESHLFNRESLLSWPVRYNIALGLASALFYLQEEWEKFVLHRNIKASNIMLDSNFKAKLGGFGQAMLMDHEKVSQTRKEFDIISFGVVLLEIASGRKAIHYQDMEGQVSLVEWVWELYRSGDFLAAADPKLCVLADAKQIECLLEVGLWCAKPDSTSRPCIRQVIKVLNFETPLPILPQ